MDAATFGDARRYDLLDKEPVQSEHDYDDIPPISSLYEFQDAVIPYVAGSTAKITARSVHCLDCCESLGSTANKTDSPFINWRDYGGLFKPSDSVFRICRLTELKIRQLLRQTKGHDCVIKFVFKCKCCNFPY